MPAYPEIKHQRRVRFEDLRTRVTQILEECGMAAEDAAVVADSLAVADLRGVHSHGILRVPEYIEKLRSKGVDPRGRPRVVKDNTAALVIDGGNSMGQIAASFAMRQAIERARTTNVAVAAVRASNHCGAMFYYAMQALSEDMIGIAATNALPTMAPWGGKDKIVGINPLAVAIPAAEEPPVVFDAAFSYSSHGKIRIYHQNGHAIPPTWALDADGQPTTDPAEAINGLLQPIGEHKGVALAIIVGMLSTLLSGASYGTELGNMVEGAKAGHDGHFLLAIRIGAFEDPERFKSRVDTILREIKTSRPVASGTRLYAPGGLEAETEALYRRDGIPINVTTALDRLFRS